MQFKKNRSINLNFSNEALFTTICALFAFVIRFFLIPSENVISWDGSYYASLGKKIISGDLSGGISAYWSPLYSFLIGVTSLLFDDLEFAGRFVSLVAGTALIVPVYFLIRDFYGRRSAYLGTILVIVHPMFIRSSFWVMTESLYTLIFTTAVLTGFYALYRLKTLNFFITGLLFGLGYLVKPETIGFVGLFFLLTVATKFFRRNLHFRSLIRGYIFLLLGFAIFLLPYVAFLHQKTGYWTISKKLTNNITSVSLANDDSGKNEGLKINDDLDMTMGDQTFGDLYPSSTQKGINHFPSTSTAFLPGAITSIKGFLSTGSRNLKTELKEYIPEIFPFFYLFAFLGILSFFYKPWTRLRAAREGYLFSFFLCTLIGYAVTVIQARYLITLIPIMLCWVSTGIVELSDWTSKSASNFLRKKRIINPLFFQIFFLLIVIVLLLSSLSTQLLLEQSEYLPLEEKQAGLWIKNHTTSPASVMAPSPIVSYYAGSTHMYLPDEELAKVLEYAQRKKINYLVFSQRRGKDTPKISFPDEYLLPEKIKLVYETNYTPSNKIVIYQLVE